MECNIKTHTHTQKQQTPSVHLSNFINIYLFPCSRTNKHSTSSQYHQEKEKRLANMTWCDMDIDKSINNIDIRVMFVH